MIILTKASGKRFLIQGNICVDETSPSQSVVTVGHQSITVRHTFDELIAKLEPPIHHTFDEISSAMKVAPYFSSGESVKAVLPAPIEPLKVIEQPAIKVEQVIPDPPPALVKSPKPSLSSKALDIRLPTVKTE